MSRPLLYIMVVCMDGQSSRTLNSFCLYIVFFMSFELAEIQHTFVLYLSDIGQLHVYGECITEEGHCSVFCHQHYQQGDPLSQVFEQFCPCNHTLAYFIKKCKQLSCRNALQQTQAATHTTMHLQTTYTLQPMQCTTEQLQITAQCVYGG